MKILIANEIFKGGVSKYTYNETEDLEIVGDIPANAEVEIKSKRNSNITITGPNRIISIGNISSIHMGNTISINGQHISTPGGITINGNSCANLTITGNVGQRARISSTSSNITVNGDIERGAKIKTVNGTINANVVYSNAEVRTTNGTINVDEIRSNAEVRATNGAINANIIHDNAEVRTTNGNIKAKVVHSNAEVKTTNGSVRVNDDRRSRRESRREHSRYNPVDPNFGTNLNVDIGNILGTVFNHPFFSSNSASSRMSSSDSEDDTTSRSYHTPQRQAAQPTAPSMETSEDLPPSYEEVVGSGAAAATGLPPAYSETPQEGETRIASNLSSSTISNPLNNLRSR